MTMNTSRKESTRRASASGRKAFRPTIGCARSSMRNGDEDLSGELTAIIAEMEIDEKRDAEVHLLYEARNRYPRAVADGLLQRVRADRTLFYGADDLLASAGFSLEDDALLEIALAETRRRDDRAEAAASVLGPQAVGRMIEAVLEAKKQSSRWSGKYDQAASDRYHDLLARIGHTPGASLIAAVRARSAQAGNEEMADLAELISRHPDGENDRGRPFDADALAAIRALAEDWGNRMLASGRCDRVATGCDRNARQPRPVGELLPLLKRLLDENLRRYRAFSEEARRRAGAARRRTRRSHPHTHEYQRAFQSINVAGDCGTDEGLSGGRAFRRSAALVLASAMDGRE